VKESKTTVKTPSLKVMCTVPHANVATSQPSPMVLVSEVATRALKSHRFILQMASCVQSLTENNAPSFHYNSLQGTFDTSEATVCLVATVVHYQ